MCMVDRRALATRRVKDLAPRYREADPSIYFFGRIKGGRHFLSLVKPPERRAGAVK